MTQRILTIVIIVSIVLGGGFYAFQQLMPEAEEANAGPVYSTAEVVRGDISVGVETSGQLNPNNGGGIQAPWFNYEGGQAPPTYVVDEVLFKEGDRVTMGQVMVRLKSPNLQAQIETAQKQLEADRKALAEKMNVSPDEIYSIDPSAGFTLRAPISGRVVGLTVKEGEELKQGTIVARVVDDSRFKVIAKLLPGEYKMVKVNQKVFIKFPTADIPMTATITDINPEPIPEPIYRWDYSGETPRKTEEITGYKNLYWATIEGDNKTGLIQPGIKVDIGLGEGPEYITYWFQNSVPIEGFVHEEQVLSNAEAIVTKVYVREMARVKKGDPIVSLSGADAREKIEEELQKIRDQEAKLQVMLSQAGQLEITAPMDGVVANINNNIQPGRTVQPGEWFGSIYNTSDMSMWSQVDDIDVLLVQQGAPVKVTVDALPNKTFEGKVMHVSTMGKDQNGIARFEVYISVKGSPELRPGMQAKAYIDAGSAKNVLLVPLEAIFEEDGQSKVEVLQPDGTTKVVAVELGLMNDRFAEVKSGLTEGQKVITGSSADILPSQHIKTNDSLLPAKPGENDNSNGNGSNQSSQKPASGK